MTALTGLQCHVCRAPFPAEALFVCDKCFGPLEAVYDYDVARRTMTRAAIEARPRNLWRYRELLPITGEPRTGFTSGFTPLVRADRLAARLGVKELYVKDDGVNHPTLSYKDRVVSVAATRAVELGFTVFGCASTGNLGNSVAAHAARLGLTCYVFIPDNLEPGKVVGSAIYQPKLMAIRGNYDDVNRLCTQIADKYRWGFANINLRTYYAEGAKTFGFEIVEQLGWRLPQHVVSPVAGGTLLPRIARAFREARTVGLVDGPMPKIYAAQAAGCAPVVKALHAGIDHPGSGEARHHRQVDRHRQPGRRLPGDRSAEGDRRLGRDGHRRRDPRRHPPAGRDRRHLHRARRRHDDGGHEEADRAGPHSARRVDRRVHHRQRLQDVRGGGRRRGAAGRARTRVQGVRDLVRRRLAPR